MIYLSDFHTFGSDSFFVVGKLQTKLSVRLLSVQNVPEKFQTTYHPSILNARSKYIKDQGKHEYLIQTIANENFIKNISEPFDRSERSWENITLWCSAATASFALWTKVMHCGQNLVKRNCESCERPLLSSVRHFTQQPIHHQHFDQLNRASLSSLKEVQNFSENILGFRGVTSPTWTGCGRKSWKWKYLLRIMKILFMFWAGGLLVLLGLGVVDDKISRNN